MTKSELLYKLMGTETPKFITELENEIVDKCLTIINDLEKKAEINVANTSSVQNNNEFSLHRKWIDEPPTEDDGHGGIIKHFKD